MFAKHETLNSWFITSVTQHIVARVYRSGFRSVMRSDDVATPRDGRHPGTVRCGRKARAEAPSRPETPARQRAQPDFFRRTQPIISDMMSLAHHGISPQFHEMAGLCGGQRIEFSWCLHLPGLNAPHAPRRKILLHFLSWVALHVAPGLPSIYQIFMSN